MELGLKGRADSVVDGSNTADAVGSGALPVFSTPGMIALMEKAALESVQPFLEPGQSTVGTRLEISHLAAAPIGAGVWAESELTAVEKRTLTFKVSAYAEGKLIGEGMHQRCIVFSERFLEKTSEAFRR